MAIDTISSSTAAASSGTGRVLSNDPTAMQDRFLKLLVAQINNQDPLNPMDNAQMTTQMAQINTVNGIQELNTTLKSMATQFSAMQVLQGAALVGHDALIEGNTLVAQNGVASGAIDLDGNADSVRIEILAPSGAVIDTLSAGSLNAGRHEFAWDATQYTGTGTPTYRIVATRAGQNITATPMVRNTVTSVGSENGIMQVQLQGRDPVAYSDIKAIL
jgi:flagellar basal-body rod modification protein FlgD